VTEQDSVLHFFFHFYALIVAHCFLVREHWKPKQQNDSNQENIMESGKADNRQTLIDSMQKRRRMSKGISAADVNTSTSSDDDNGKQFTRAEHFKDKMKTRRRQSRGAAQGQNSSDGDCSSQGEECVPSPTDYLKNKLGKQRRRSCGIAVGDCSSEEDIGNAGEGSGLSKGASPSQYLKDKVSRQRSRSCGIAVGDCSSEEDISNAGEGSGLSKGASPSQYLKDKISRQRSRSCGIAAGDYSSDEGKGSTTIDLDRP